MAFVLAAAPASSRLVAQEPVTNITSPAALAYRIQVGDLLRMRLLAGGDQPDIVGDFPVEAGGTAFFPRIGPIQAAGLSVEELIAKLRASYGQTFISFAVTVIPVFPVSVIGAVRLPSTIDGSPGMTIFDAIARAGGFTELADRKRIVLIRDGRSTVLNGLDDEGMLALAAMGLHQNDRIMVSPKSGINLQTI